MNREISYIRTWRYSRSEEQFGQTDVRMGSKYTIRNASQPIYVHPALIKGFVIRPVHN